MMQEVIFFLFWILREPSAWHDIYGWHVYGDVVLQGFEFIKPKIMLEQSEVLANKKKYNTATVQKSRFIILE